jgi:hypothetical protein
MEEGEANEVFKRLRVCGNGGGAANKVLKILRMDIFIFGYAKD